MSVANKQTVREIYARINQGQLERVAELISPQFAGAGGQRGSQAFIGGIAALRAAFPDLRYTLEALVSEGDLVAVRWTWRGTHTGAFRTIAATGKHLSNSGQAIFTFAEGKVASTSLETDRLGFLLAIGVIADDPLFGPPRK